MASMADHVNHVFLLQNDLILTNKTYRIGHAEVFLERAAVKILENYLENTCDGVRF